ncbi:MAG: LemA family protein [Paludibacteraceae bacterium]|jgi:LemA protein|nr:LemA family protein [Paludibacteraceae bacterium]MCK9615903.1 LemA family protein [Candidatus Omnitrophota bacterium]
MKSAMVGCLTMLVILFVVSFVCIAPILVTYNGLQVMDERCNESWAEIDNQLERKDKLIPNLVATVKGYAKHESKVMEDIATARSQLLNAKTAGEKYEANDGLSKALGRLMMLTENYPDLKADKQFIQLQDQLEGCENRITVARMDYNKTAKILNTKIRTFPTSLIVGIAKVEKRQYFEASDKVRQNSVSVSFE